MKQLTRRGILFFLMISLLLCACSANHRDSDVESDAANPAIGGTQIAAAGDTEPPTQTEPPAQSDPPASAEDSGARVAEVSFPNNQTTDYESFGTAVSELVKRHSATDGTAADGAAAAAARDEFYSGRLIIQASAPIDTAALRPSACIEGPDHLYILQFANAGEAKAALQTLSNVPEVIYAEPDGFYQAEVQESSAAEFKSWGVRTIGADRLADYVRGVTSDRVSVAVVDSGVSSHSFFSGRLLAGGYDFVDNDDNPDDLLYHGTHVAGTIVDCTPRLNVFILPIRVLGADGYGYQTNVGAGIRYAADHGAKVINLSLGGGHSDFVDAAVQYALRKGVSVVVSAGNDSMDIGSGCPAHIPEAITVGAVDARLKQASFSNTGTALDLVCPGVDIVSCIPGGSFTSLDGTSMAAPHAAASVAMLRLLYPALSPGELENLLCSHTTDLGPRGRDNNYGAGLPDLTQFVPAEEPEILPTEIRLSADSLWLPAGANETLSAAVLPADADQTVFWSSSEPAVATVSEYGIVHAVSGGSATITAATSNGLTAACIVTVESPYTSGISVSSEPNRVSYYVGETLDPTGLELLVTGSDGSYRYVTDGYTCSPMTLNSPGTQTITVRCEGQTTSFTVSVEQPAVYLSSYSDTVTKNCWDSYWNRSEKVPLWMLSLPEVTTSPGSGEVRWRIVSGHAYMAEDYIAAQQPETITARAEYTYLGHTYTADYTVTLRMYKTTSDINYLHVSPSRESAILDYVPNGATVDITEVSWDADVQARDGRYYLYGKTVYNGIDGWIVIS